MSLYSADFEDYLPVWYTGKIPNLLGAYWKKQLSSYLGVTVDISNYERAKATLADGVFRCPSYSAENLAMKEPTDIQISQFGGYGYNRNFLGNQPKAENMWVKNETKLTQVKDAVDTIAIGDSGDAATWAPFHSAVLPFAESNGAFIGERHDGAINLLWLDGHVAPMKKWDLMNGKDKKRNYYYMWDKGKADGQWQ